MNANYHFGRLRYPLIMHTILFPYVADYLNNKQNWSQARSILMPGLSEIFSKNLSD